jgi:cellulose synthase/poly-beta-1,6-N-acetylglucosamine synthase-like glycosyltransferase
MLKVFFWLFLLIIIYAYFGYTLVLLMFASLKKLITRKRKEIEAPGHEPPVTLIIPAYNEIEYIDRKVRNTQALNYPKDKLEIIWITDGSDDGTAEALRNYPEIKVFHEVERKGKIHAMNRGLKLVKNPIVIFTDANTMLNPEAVKEIVKCFMNPKVGCVAGEKRIRRSLKEKAVDAGEGLYWRYESYIKRLESETGSVMGAAGELFAIRRELYHEVAADTILDDFTISLQIAQQGYEIKYLPGAWGTETSSVSITEELKRKIRIAAGGMQAMIRMPSLLNPFKHGLLSFKYISHKVLRWVLVPVSIILVLLLNLIIVFLYGYNSPFFIAMLILQCVFYLSAFIGALLKNVRLGFGAFFVPYYLFMMNFAVFIGCIRYFTGNYAVTWQKVKRS